MGGVLCEVGDLFDALVVNGERSEPGRAVEERNADQDQDDHQDHILLDLILNAGAHLGLRRDLNIVFAGVLLSDVHVGPIEPRPLGLELVLLDLLLLLLLDILKYHYLVPYFFDLVVGSDLADLN